MSEFRFGKFDRIAVPRALKNLCPEMAAASLASISVSDLVSQGKRLVLLDVDNTLLGWHKEEIPETTIKWIDEAKKAGLNLCILSNTRNKERLQRIGTELGIVAKCGRFKPHPSMYREALAEFECPPSRAVMIGDQIFTDMLGANLAGIGTIWVKQMTPFDFVGTKISRFGEGLVSRFFYRTMQPDATTKAVTFFERPVVRQFVCFCIIGVSSLVIDVGLHRLMMFGLSRGDQSDLSRSVGEWLTNIGGPFRSLSSFQASFPVFKVLTGGLAMLNSFILNRKFTFGIRGKENRAEQMMKFFVVASIGLVLNTIIGALLVNIVPGHRNRTWAVSSAIAAVVVAFWNFTGQKLWTFKNARP